MVNRVLLTIFFVLIVGSSAFAQVTLPWHVTASGGGIGATSGTRVLSGTIGQTIIGVVSITNGNQLSQGFWLPLRDTALSVDEGTSPSSLATDVVNYPNPFSSSTTIKFLTPVEGAVTIRVYDLAGNLVRTLNVELSLTGGQEVLFDGLSDSMTPLGSGNYLYEVSGTGLDGKHYRKIQRMTILR